MVPNSFHSMVTVVPVPLGVTATGTGISPPERNCASSPLAAITVGSARIFSVPLVSNALIAAAIWSVPLM